MSWMPDQERLSRILLEELKCPICLDEFVEPKSLSCSHTVCKECLSNMVQGVEFSGYYFVRCPTCRLRTDIDFPGGIDNLPTNHIVTSLISGNNRANEIKEIEDRIKRDRQALSVRRELITEMVDKGAEGLSHQRKKVEGDIRQHAQKIVQMVQDSEKSLIQELNTRVASQQRELRQKREVLEKMTSCANEILKGIEEKVNTLPTRKLLEEKSSIVSQLVDIDAIELAMGIPEVVTIALISNISENNFEHLTALGRIEMRDAQDQSALGQVVPDYSNDNVQISAFGSSGNGKGQFMLPWGVAVRDDGCIAVADHVNNRIQVFDNQGVFLQAFPDSETETVRLPTGIDFDLDHNVVTFDRQNREIKVLDSMGRLIRKISKDGDLSDMVEGLSIDSEGRIIVTDASTEQILVYHHSGNLSLKFGATGKNKLGRPSCAVFNRGRFIVSDTFNHCLKVFNRHGIYLQQIGRPGKEAGQFCHPRGLAVDASNNLLVCDSGNCRVQVLDCDGNFIRSFGKQGHEVGNFSLPYSIAIGKQSEVIVSDCSNDRLQIFKFPFL